MKTHLEHARTIFISYSWRDARTVQHLAQRLQAIGYSPWIDYLYLNLDTDIASQLLGAISRAAVFVLVDTTYARASAWVRFEVCYARSVIPHDRFVTLSSATGAGFDVSCIHVPK